MKMETAKKPYSAQWIYGQQCQRHGQIKAECAAETLEEFAHQLCTAYAYELGDGFSFYRWESEKDIRDCYGDAPDDLPGWFSSITAYPVLEFTSDCGDEILCNPTPQQIIDHIRGEHYGDYDLRITGTPGF